MPGRSRRSDRSSSTFAGRIGQRVAAKGVTVLDDGTIADRRGSLNVDDEGHASQKNVLIEDGILKGMYLFKDGGDAEVKVQLMGSGTILREVEAAADLLRNSADLHPHFLPAHIFLAASYGLLGELKQAQAIGDLQSLHTHQRPAVRIALGPNPVRTLRSLVTFFTPAKATRRKSVPKKRTTPTRRPRH